MKFSKKLILSAFACAFALGASAQGAEEVPTYLKRDVLTYANICSSLGDRVITFNTEVAHYAAVLMKQTRAVTFDGEKEQKHGLIANSSTCVLEKLEFNWMTPSNEKTTVLFYAQETPYEEISDLTGKAEDEIVFKQTTFLPKGNYRYWGLEKGSLVAYFSEIIATWHLAYFRENLNTSNLGTICLPYDVKAEDLADELTPYTIVGKLVDNSLGENNVEALIFEEVEDLKAGVAYIFLPKKNDICLKYFGTKVASPLDNKEGFIGTFEKHVFTEDECQRDKMFVISQNRITLVGVGLEMGANRAYIKMSDVPVYQEENSSRKLIVSADGYIEMGGNLTTVEMLKAISSLKSRKKFSSSTFDLYGRILGDATTNGVILQNGKKKIVRVK